MMAFGVMIIIKHRRGAFADPNERQAVANALRMTNTDRDAPHHKLVKIALVIRAFFANQYLRRCHGFSAL